MLRDNGERPFGGKRKNSLANNKAMKQSFGLSEQYWIKNAGTVKNITVVQCSLNACTFKVESINSNIILQSAKQLQSNKVINYCRKILLKTFK